MVQAQTGRRTVVGTALFLIVALLAVTFLINPHGGARASTYPAWDPNSHAYAVGDIVYYATSGHDYKCIQAHTSQPGWDPVSVPALWSDLGADTGGSATATRTNTTAAATATKTNTATGATATKTNTTAAATATKTNTATGATATKTNTTAAATATKTNTTAAATATKTNTTAPTATSG